MAKTIQKDAKTLEPLPVASQPAAMAPMAQITTYAMSVDEIVAQIELIQDLMKRAMKKGEHYGTIPGCGDKYALLKPGAEKLTLLFRFAVRYQTEVKDLERGHREYTMVCEIYSQITGAFLGAGVGTCSSMESKYRFRTQNTGRPVPQKYWETRDTSFLGGPQFSVKKGWIKLEDGKSKQAWTVFERIEHDNPADNFNTVMKMAAKRAHIAAILTVTAASDIFTQDLEEVAENAQANSTEDQFVGDGELPPEDEPLPDAAAPQEAKVTIDLAALARELAKIKTMTKLTDFWNRHSRVYDAATNKKEIGALFVKRRKELDVAPSPAPQEGGAEQTLPL